ncbi:MAG: Uma2 family endonuclease [Cyanobacteria bacterium]|nr:Uma2 family endonuclease [Cyanobacteria bacterium CG_2015-16_32_12]NCO77310.1 Uma2 family endonuclease [Cyanobacteria bacterium CG_2015-22_32_23]NCQ05607.1 Uma2 family endonuclease [Cyanobacteria bacterium CG_2015-09_32_10]NCQ41417.1 Uma2 family endonuclease [Cyanobacteria bacterium CG_2015-04_32_10]NCS86149.1 Uma2 family endonuclease [Cyanobacteria bacterium CG_2015-02_32_10]
MTLTITDIDKIQQQNSNLKYELKEGEIIIMSPSDFLSEDVGGGFLTYLKNWVNPRKLGRVTGSSAGFIMPNGDLLAPDVAFVKAEKLKVSPRSYAEVVPDLVVEIKSASDRVSKLENKLKNFLEFGAMVAIFIDPDEHIVKVFRSNSEVEIFTDNDILTIPELFPDWQLKIVDLWPEVFE